MSQKTYSMKVFWFTNIILPELAKSLGRKPEIIGGWMSSLLDDMCGSADVEVPVATIAPGAENLVIHVVNGMTYFRLPIKRTKGTPITPAFMAACTDAISAYKPDIIHVHGTEDVYGLFTSLNTCTYLDCYLNSRADPCV